MGAVSIIRDCDHKNRIHMKHELILGLKALYDEWLPYRDPDHPEMQRIMARIHRAETQLGIMRP